jgi:hypothetical protein
MRKCGARVGGGRVGVAGAEPVGCGAGDAGELALDRRVGTERLALLVFDLRRRAVAHGQEGVAAQGVAGSAALVDLERAIDRLARLARVAQPEMRLRHRLERRYRLRVRGERLLQEAHGLGGVAGGHACAGGDHVGVRRRRDLGLLPDRLDQPPGDAGREGALFVADLAALVPGAVGFDRAPVDERDGVGGGAAGTEHGEHRR